MLRRLLLAALAVGAVAPLQSQSSSIDQLGWMAGCWRRESATRVADEIWMSPSGGAMLGMSRTVSKGRVIEYEFLQIREDGGKISFVAKPSGQPEASFAMTRAGVREVVFENPAHDFPQRISYGLVGNTLTGRIAGRQNGVERGVDYEMRKVACPSEITAPGRR